MTNKFKYFLIPLFLALTILFGQSGCKSESRKASQDVNIEDFVTEDDIFDDIDKAKKIFLLKCL